MCAVGRALMANPSMVLLDEPSMGLAPQIVDEVFGIVKDLNQKEGVTFLLAEQNTNMALRYADFGYILENGRVVMEGAAKDLAANEDVKEFYLGLSSAGARASATSSTIAAASAGFPDLARSGCPRPAALVPFCRARPGSLAGVRLFSARTFLSCPVTSP
jgi:ABC-type multidrug transport system ATPase subunit